ncbi:hypothetical protein B9Z55_013835 [Caenorhabditis nigoni]|uniref:Uncharacterized protein n=1 Tax=Caenorhabditis nigoni TaxID=1611254 RepID=A0A2G5U3M2_9PELO|nr:hypothetical protein B9Z55_013835 [Caenorhabditis nigoni]
MLGRFAARHAVRYSKASNRLNQCHSLSRRNVPAIRCLLAVGVQQRTFNTTASMLHRTASTEHGSVLRPRFFISVCCFLRGVYV